MVDAVIDSMFTSLTVYKPVLCGKFANQHSPINKHVVLVMVLRKHMACRVTFAFGEWQAS